MQRRPPAPPRAPVDNVDAAAGTELEPTATHSLLDAGSQHDKDSHLVSHAGDPIYGIGIGVLVGAACWLLLWLLYVALA